MKEEEEERENNRRLFALSEFGSALSAADAFISRQHPLAVASTAIREDVSLQASSSFVLRASEIQLSSFVLKKKKKKKGVMISLYLFYDKKKEAKKREKKEKKRKRDHYRT
jgi:hypothetical protein